MPGSVMMLRVPVTVASRLGYSMAAADANATVHDNCDSSSWEPHVAIPLGSAFAVLLVWRCVDSFVRRGAKQKLPSEPDEWGMPLWSTGSRIWTQLLVLPGCLLLALVRHHFRLAEWQEAAGRALFTVDGARYWDWAFMYIFSAYMLEDMVRFPKMAFLMKVHHIGCLVHAPTWHRAIAPCRPASHASGPCQLTSLCRVLRPSQLGLGCGFVAVPSGFPLFCCGAVALEIGSAFLNVYCLCPSNRRLLIAYVAMMSISNLTATLCCGLWLSSTQTTRAIQCFAASITAIFVYVRQEAAWEATVKYLTRGAQNSAS
jgi:hypothetical protein